jgi:large subunit ribosomal protein L31
MKTTENTQPKTQPKKEKVVKSDSVLPDYRPVLFIDNSNGAEFIIASTVHSTEKAKAKSDGKEYPVYRLEISSSSHPFYTGKEKTLDTAGRVEKFKSRVATAKSKSSKVKK